MVKLHNFMELPRFVVESKETLQEFGQITELHKFREIKKLPKFGKITRFIKFGKI